MRKHKRNVTVKRFISLALAAVLLAEAPSWDTLAADGAGMPEENRQQEAAAGVVWEELTEKREENVKWFSDGAGNLKAAIYDRAVHYFTDEGWQEMDSIMESYASGEEGEKEAEYLAGYDIEGREIYTYIEIPEECLYLEGYTLTEAKISFADTRFIDNSEDETGNLSIGIFLCGSGEADASEEKDTDNSRQVSETAGIFTETSDTEAAMTEINVPEAGTAEKNDADTSLEISGIEADDTVINDTMGVGLGEVTEEAEEIRTALSEIIDVKADDCPEGISFNLDAGVLSECIYGDARLLFGCVMGRGVISAGMTDTESGILQPLWECIFEPEENAAEENSEADYDISDGEIDISGINSDSSELRIIGEIEEKRDSNTKYFLTEGGGEIAAVYAEPVHYEKDGKWLDIDNSLELVEKDGEKRYCSSGTGTDISFAMSSGEQELVIIDDGEHAISWGLEDAALAQSTYSDRKFTRQLYKNDISNMMQENQTDGPQNNVKEWLKPESIEETGAESSLLDISDESSPAAVGAAVAEIVAGDWNESGSAYNNETDDNSKYNLEQMKVENLSEGGRYAEILPGIDIQYIVNSVNIKENIIVKSREAAKADITLRISHPDTVLIKEDDGSITVRSDYDSDEVLYRFIVPFMYDSAGALSEKVEYILNEETGDASLLTIKADQQWLLDSDRVYPVTIDPVTETTQNRATIEDTFIREKYPSDADAGTFGRIYVGRNRGYERCRGLVRFTSLPELENGALIYKAVLNVWQYGYSADSLSEFNITAHEVTGSWSEASTTWNSRPEYSRTVLDYETVTSASAQSPALKQFDVTSLVRKWYSTGVNYGIMLKGAESTYAESYFIASNNMPEVSEGYPSAVFCFKNTAGTESYWSYHEQAAGEAGIGYTNDFNGNLVFTVPDLATGGNLMPLSISHVYNGCDSDKSSRMGNGWRLNVMQTLETSGYTDFPYVYTDGDGTRHYFYTDKNDGNKLKDEDGLGLTIIQTSSSNTALYRIIECKDKSRLVFDVWGYLRREIDANGNTISYNYSPVSGGENYLSSATDASGAGVIFQYNSDISRLTGIIDTVTNRRTAFTYDSAGNLSEITHTSGRKSAYSYNSSNKLTRASAADGRAIEYRYVKDFNVFRVSMFREVGSQGTVGQSVEAAYYNGNKTVFNYPGLDGDTTLRADNPVITYRFDTMGRPISVSDESGAASSYSYYNESRTSNRLKESGAMQNTVCNLLINAGIDPVSMVTAQGDPWYAIKTPGCPGYGVSRITDKGYIGNTCIRVDKSPGGSGFAAQDVTVSETGTYTLSAYVKTSGIAGTSYLSDGAGLMVTYLSGSKNGQSVLSKKTIQGTTNEAVDNGWERVTLTFTVPEAGTTLRVMGGIFNQSGTAWFDCFQLEKGGSANAFNMVNNAGFERVSSGSAPQAWEQYNITSGDGCSSVPHEGSYSAAFQGKTNTRKYLRQEIKTSGKEGDVYCLSGWAKANAIPGEEFRISAEIRYSDGSRGWKHFDFDPYITDWQFTGGMFSTDDNNASTDLTYTSIIIHAFYQNQYNMAYFDGIQLLKDDGTSYVYDSDGNLVSAKSASSKESFSYDSSSNLKKLVNPDGTAYSYGYDSKNNLMTAQSSDGQGYTFTYDSHGNPLTSVLSGSKDAEAGQTYYIRQKTSGKYLDVKGASDANGTIVQQYRFNGGSNQKWKLIDAGDGYYYIQSMVNGAGKVMEVYGADTSDGAQVSIYTKNNSIAQKWKIKKLDDGSCQIIAACTDDKKCLTNYKGSTSDSTAITTRPINGTHNDQSWFLEPVENDRIKTSMSYTSTGRQAASVTDACGNTISYYYSAGERLLTKTEDSKGTETAYTYDSNTEYLTKVSSGGSEVTYAYDFSKLSAIGHNGFTYSFAYDQFGNTASVKAGEHTLVTNEYLPHDGMLSKSVYGNGADVQYSYTKDEQVSQVSYNGSAAFTYRYDSAGNITEKNDLAAGVSYYYSYDLIGRPTVMRTDNGQALQVSYDSKNRTDAVISAVKGVTTETGFIYGDGSSGKPEGAVSGVSVDGQTAVEYFYDSLGRLKYKYAGLDDTGTDIEYTYKAGASAGQTSTLVSSVYDDNVITSYTYDSLGNITSVKISGPDGIMRHSYVYDALGQMVRDNDGEQGKTITYAYDAGGNITEKKVYAYTTGDPGEPLDTITYGYDDASWKDMLTSYDGQAITYDEIGNPLSYRDGMSFTWIRGRRLGSLSVGDTAASYQYDDSGIRTKKIINGAATDYYLNGSNILTQISGDTRLDFFYDEQGSVIGFKYNNGIYLYKKNLQGDIIGIKNSAGEQTVSYRYDSWGKLLAITGTEAETIGQLNPFRYRGYYYDSESGLYYLNSRYYDAETGRFLNADGYVSTGQGVLGYNMFAYCNNNPVNMSDEDGNNPGIIIPIIIGIEIVAAAIGIGIAARNSSSSGITANIGKEISQTINSVKNFPKLMSVMAAAKIYESKVEKQAEKEVAEAIVSASSSSPTLIYRYGRTNPGNLTPKPKDALSGLSFSMKAPPSGTPAAVTTIEALNATGMLIAFNDRPNHVSVIPAPHMGTLQNWIDTGSSHPCTAAVKSVVIKWDEGY